MGSGVCAETSLERKASKKRIPEKKWLGVYFPHLGLEVFTRQEKALAQCPVVLLENNRVVQRNAQAAQLNIGIASTLATAHAVAPKVKHFNRDLEEEQKRLTYLAEVAYSLTNEVSLHAPDSLVLEIHHSRKLFGSAQEVMAALSKHFNALQHRVVMQIGATPLASLAMVKAKYCLDKTTNDLSCVPLTCTNLTSPIIEHLTNMGLNNLGQLFTLPKKELAQRFGKDIVDYLSRLKGDKADPQKNLKPKPEYKNSIHLLESARDKKTLLFPMQRLTEELSHWLTTNQLGTSQLIWFFSPFAKQQGKKLVISLATPHQNQTNLYNLSQLKFESAGLPEDVVGIELKASRLSPWENTSQALFKYLTPPNTQELSALIDRLHARLGMEVCSGINLANDHRPELAWCQAKLLTTLASKTTDDPLKNGASRPLWLFTQPKPVQQRKLELLQGPERIQTGWWDRTVKRDYYVARHVNGALCWVFVHQKKHTTPRSTSRSTSPSTSLSTSGDWFIHGYFS